MTDFERLRDDAPKLSGDKLRQRAVADIGYEFPEDWDDTKMRSAIAEWFASYDAIRKLKGKGESLDESPYVTGVAKK